MELTTKLTHEKELRALYKAAFPKEERKPMTFIHKLRREGKCVIHSATENGKFIGLAIMLTDEKFALLDYLAVDPSLRSMGYGAKILDELREIYADKCLFLERETVLNSVENAHDRDRRRRFYLKNGLSDTGIYVNVYTVEMTLMTFGKSITFEEYAAFLKKTLGTLIFNKIKVIRSDFSDENLL